MSIRNPYAGSGDQVHCYRDSHDQWREVERAREAAHAKHGVNSIERVPALDYARWLPILGEEFGEVCRTLTYDQDPTKLRGELIDLLAVGSAWVAALDAEKVRM